WVLVHLIAGITNIALFHRLSWTLPAFATLDTGPNLVIVALAGGLAVSLLALWSPEIRGHGIPEAMEAVLTKQSKIPPRAALAKPLSAAIAIGTGGPFGAEGPIIVTGGALGSLIGQFLPVTPSERKILLACGAAGGMAATFGTPLAAVVLAIELLLFEFSVRAFVPLVVSTTLAGGVHSALFGTGPLFAVPPHDYTGLEKLPVYAVLGLVCGLVAVVITRGLFLVEGGFRRLPVPAFWHPAIGAAGFAVIGLFEPRALGVGYDAISDVLTAKLAVGTVAVLALAKFAAWCIALASGTSGGTLAPLLLISGAVGTVLGVGADRLLPGAHISPGGFALVAMAATFGASVRATFTAIVFLFELTRDYQIILPLMLASVLAEIVANALLPDSLMTEKLSRRGLRVQSDFEVDILRSVVVRTVMTTDVETVSPALPIGEARARLEAGEHGAYPLVNDQGVCVGIVARHDFLKANLQDNKPLALIATRDVVTVTPDDTLLVALRRMLEEDVGHLPVVEGNRRGAHLVGMCTRTDVLRARRVRLESERLQPGWVGLGVNRRRWPLRLGFLRTRVRHQEESS
ncbi:MAG TPA: chloride channel protein, partial [Acidimicrobiia bacterium]|nr:chloride channel protein [Acidimicrobiia bacterium]